IEKTLFLLGPALRSFGRLQLVSRAGNRREPLRDLRHLARNTSEVLDRVAVPIDLDPDNRHGLFLVESRLEAEPRFLRQGLAPRQSLAPPADDVRFEATLNEHLVGLEPFSTLLLGPTIVLLDLPPRPGAEFVEVLQEFLQPISLLGILDEGRRSGM